MRFCDFTILAIGVKPLSLGAAPSVQAHRKTVRREYAELTNTGDEALFHARGGIIEWDGIDLEQLLERQAV